MGLRQHTTESSPYFAKVNSPLPLPSFFPRPCSAVSPSYTAGLFPSPSLLPFIMYEQDDSTSGSSHSAMTITPKTTPSGEQVGRETGSEHQQVDQLLEWQPEGTFHSELTEPIEHEAAAVLSLMSYACTPAKPAEVKRGRRRGSKSHVASACINCKKAHLACDSNFCV